MRRVQSARISICVRRRWSMYTAVHEQWCRKIERLGSARARSSGRSSALSSFWSSSVSVFASHQLGAIGFAEDEMNKLDAVQLYERGDFTANCEHPMVMKVLMWAFFARRSRRAAKKPHFDFPNALIGALTVIPLFLLTLALFDRWTRCSRPRFGPSASTRSHTTASAKKTRCWSSSCCSRSSSSCAQNSSRR